MSVATRMVRLGRATSPRDTRPEAVSEALWPVVGCQDGENERAQERWNDSMEERSGCRDQGAARPVCTPEKEKGGSSSWRAPACASRRPGKKEGAALGVPLGGPVTRPRHNWPGGGGGREEEEEKEEEEVWLQCCSELSCSTSP
ncbi:unnamed protein product, partial [Prorocentrum cordatum]